MAGDLIKKAREYSTSCVPLLKTNAEASIMQAAKLGQQTCSVMFNTAVADWLRTEGFTVYVHGGYMDILWEVPVK